MAPVTVTGPYHFLRVVFSDVQDLGVLGGPSLSLLPLQLWVSFSHPEGVECLQGLLPATCCHVLRGHLPLRLSGTPSVASGVGGCTLGPLGRAPQALGLPRRPSTPPQAAASPPRGLAAAVSLCWGLDLLTLVGTALLAVSVSPWGRMDRGSPGTSCTRSEQDLSCPACGGDSLLEGERCAHVPGRGLWRTAPHRDHTAGRPRRVGGLSPPPVRTEGWSSALPVVL